MTTKNKTKQSGSNIPNAPGIKSTSDPIISVRNLKKWYQVGGGIFNFGAKSYLKAVDDVSFDIERGKTFGLVGESGCGKTTTLKVLLGLEELTGGEIYYEGEDVAKMSKERKNEFRRSVQAVFQDPWSSLNPRMKVGSIVGEPLEIQGKMTKKEISLRVGDLLSEVGLNPYQANLYPHEFSGGQRQRIAIARALILEPKILILDEPTSALDVTIQNQIIELLIKLQIELNLSLIFISHDIGVIRSISDKIVVLRNGIIVESGTSKEVLDKPINDYTRNLVSSVI